MAYSVNTFESLPGYDTAESDAEECVESRTAGAPTKKTVMATGPNQQEANAPDFAPGAGLSWQSFIAELSQPQDGKVLKAATRSLASCSTAASLRSSASGRSSARAPKPRAGSRPLRAPAPVESHAEAATDDVEFGKERVGSGYHLGAILGCGAPRSQGVSQGEEVDVAWQGRFLDLLEDADVPSSEAVTKATAEVLASRERVAKVSVLGHATPFALLDPTLPGCPLVVGSAGFEKLTGLQEQSAVGMRGEDLLANEACVSQQAVVECGKLCEAAGRGEFFQGAGAPLVAIADAVCAESLPSGEFACSPARVEKNGKLIRGAVHLKQVELDDEMYVVCFLTGHPAAHQVEEGPQPSEVILNNLNSEMNAAVQVLAQEFWYSAPMRRQTACPTEF